MNEEEIWGGNEGILSVFVSKAKDLPNLVKLDKQNVMLRLRIAHMTRESDIIFRGGQNPRFDYLEKFPITPSVKPIMIVEVYCERKNKNAIPIGKCEVDLLNGMRADPTEGYCVWYDLKKDANEFAGTIFIELTFQPNIQRNLVNNGSKNSYDLKKMDASFAARPIPPLPNENIMSKLDLHPDMVYSKSYGYSPSNSASHSPGHNEYSHSTYDNHHESFINLQANHGLTLSNVKMGVNYTHGSEMRQITPQINNLDMLNNLNSNNFDSSIASNNTMITDNTTSTTTTTTSADTKFHFANLRKLKERMNIFKNPNSSVNDNESVDIQALEKAIGVTMNEEESNSENEADSDIEDRRRDFTRNSNESREFSRSSNSFGRSVNSGGNDNYDINNRRLAMTSNSRVYTTDINLERDNVRKMLPELPNIPITRRDKSMSPRRRPLPPS